MDDQSLEILPHDPLCPPHDSAHLHVTGQSVFIDDRAYLGCEVHVGLVYSPHAKARIIAIDTQAATKIDGVVCILTAKDLHHNHWGSIFPDQPLLAEHEVNYVGEVIAVVGATSTKILKQALAAIHVNYEVMPAILSLDVAITRKSFIGAPREIKRGQAELELERARHRLSGSIDLKGADHFYLENQSALA
jgi:xanthine dehydrogenase large subunit